MPVQEVMLYKCDCCGFEQTFYVWEGPKGWHTERDDHQDCYCPGCTYESRRTGTCKCGREV